MCLWKDVLAQTVCKHTPIKASSITETKSESVVVASDDTKGSMSTAKHTDPETDKAVKQTDQRGKVVAGKASRSTAEISK